MKPRKEDNTMFNHQIPDSELIYHLQQIRSGYASAQREISIDGLREMIGSTFIQVGARIHGTARDVREEAEQRRLAAHMICRAGALAK